MRRIRTLTVIALALAAAGAAFRPVVVVGESMAPTLRNCQVMLSPRMRQSNAVNRGDIVVFRQAGDACVKRVVAVAGDVVYLVRFSNGAANFLGDGMPTEKVLRLARCRPDQARIDRVRVPRGHVFVAGDNRFCSEDSRDFGPVPVERILGLVETPAEALRGAVADVGRLWRVASAPLLQHRDIA